MKFSHVCLLALVALMSLAFVAATEREVRSYTSDMEYVDHVDMSQSEDLPVADHAMMETSSEHEEENHNEEHEEEHMHFSMEDESSPSELDLSSFIESSSEEVDTEAMRQMALEIHDSAQAMIDDNGEVLMEMQSEINPNAGLTPQEIQEEKEDNANEKKDKAAEQKDKAEEKVEKKEAAADAKILATPAPVATAAPAKKEETAAPAAAATSSSSAAPAATSKDVVQLPADLSGEHAETLRANEAASATISTALKEVGAILQSKDDTIRSLVYNISYLTVGIGKLANKVDLQRSYIGLLKNKLRLSKAKVKQLKSHVAHSKKTASSIREQLKAVERRLNRQDAKTTKVTKFLSDNQDKIRLPELKDDLEIRGAPVRVAPKRRRSINKVRSAINSRLRPVEGTQTYADAAHFIPAAPVQFFPQQYFDVTPQYPFDGIPTIVVERQDDGQ